MNALVRIGCGVAVLLTLVSPALAARTLTPEERIDALRRVEAVSWSHRIWPAENPGPKPPLSEVVPDEALAARVEEMLRGMRALEAVWGRSIGKEEIQAELDRMTRLIGDIDLLAAVETDKFTMADVDLALLTQRVGELVTVIPDHVWSIE